METQDDSLDIVKLQRVALGLVSVTLVGLVPSLIWMGTN